MNIKFLGCWVFGGPAIIAFGFTIVKDTLSKDQTLERKMEGNTLAGQSSIKVYFVGQVKPK